MADGPLSAALAEIRHDLGLSSHMTALHIGRQGERLLAALDAVLALHRPVLNVMYEGDRCPECRDQYGGPLPFAECRARKTILGALKGEGNG